MRWLLGLLLVGLTCPSVSLFAQSGKLGAVRKEVREPEPEKAEEKREASEPDCCRDEDDGDSFLGEMLAYTIAAPFWAPKVAIEGESCPCAYFPAFPYSDNHSGYLILPQELGQEKGLRTWAGRFSVEYGTDFDGLEKVGGRLLLETTSRFGVQARLDYFQEKLWCGCIDELYLGSTELIFRFAQSPKIQMYAGLGVRWLDDRADTEWGFNFTYGADLFPVKPLVVSLSIDAGTLGDAGVFEARGTVGAIFHRFEVFTGYEHRWIGSADLGTFLTGLRVWY